MLLTGATGFVGAALLRALLARGMPPDRIRCLVRAPERAMAAGIPVASAWIGDLGDPRSLARAAEGIDLCLHVAGAVKGYRPGHFLEANAMGTARLVDALTQAVPGARLVLVSSLAAAGPSPDGATSLLPPDRCRPCSLYGESKRQGELAVVGAQGLAWTVVRPPIVYGPGDAATRLLFRQALGPVCLVPRAERPLSIIHVDDLVAALLRAAEGRATGRILAVEGPDRTTTHDLLAAIARACGRRARLVPVPMVLPRTAAVAADLWARLRRRPGFFSQDKVREIGAPGWVADGAPARQALGWQPQVTLAAGLAAVAVREGFARPGAAG